MKYDFDTIVDRLNTNSMKWDFVEEVFGEKDILPLWVADMDFRTSDAIINAIVRVAQHGIFGYSKMGESYYQAVIQWMKRRHGWDIEKEWIVFSPGVVPALNLLIRSFTQPRDKVIIQSPAYYPFFHAVKNNGCQVLDNPLLLENDQYIMDLPDLQSKIDNNTKLILLCSPHNPVGRVWDKEELIQLGRVCIDNNIIIIADEIHCDIVYRGRKHVPFASIPGKFADNSIVCTGASKTFNLPGLQTSNIIIRNPKLRHCLQKTMLSCGLHLPNTFGIAATEAAYRYGEPWLEQLIDYLQENITFLTSYINERIPTIKVIQPQGTYLVWLDCKNIGVSPANVYEFLVKQAKVGIEEGTPFGCKEKGFIRMNIACPRSTLSEALYRIEEAVHLLNRAKD